MIEVSRLKDLNAAKLFLGFRIGAIGGRDFAVFPVQGQRGLRRLKRYFGDKMSVGAQMVVVLKAFVERCVSLVLGHPFEFSWLDVSQTDVFHCSSPHSGLAEPAAERCAGSFIPSIRRVLRPQWPGCLLASVGSLCRSRAEKNLAHLARRTAGDGTLARPRQRLVHISGFKYPETAYVLLGLGVRAVGDEHLAVGLGPKR